MGRNDWQQAVEMDDVAAAMVPRKRGKVLRVLGFLLLLAMAALLLGYYVPLYRAHLALTTQYRNLATQSAEQRRQLTGSIETLKRISEERDALAVQARTHTKQEEGAALQADHLDRDIETGMKKFFGKGRIEKRREGAVMKLSLSAPVVLGIGTAALTDFGKKALCALAVPLKTSSARVRITGFGVLAQPKGKFSFALGAARAANIATQLTETCTLAPEAIEIDVGQTGASVDRAAEIVVTAKGH